MAELKRTFVQGKMNKKLDERLIQDGEYVDALNVRVNSNDGGQQGVAENAMGNTQLTDIIWNQVSLSSNAKVIGSYEDGSNETIYWFIHDEMTHATRPVGKIDMIVSYNTQTKSLTNHLTSTREGTKNTTTLNFNTEYPIHSVVKIEDLLLWTDNYNQPRFINVKKGYAPYVNLYIDGFTAEELLVVKKPPINSPTTSEISIPNSDNYIEDRFLSFAYRYRYENGEYSATSQFTQPSFIPNNFNYNIDSGLNEGMINSANAVEITYNTGSSLVVGVDLLFKEMSSNTIKVIEKLDKEELGLSDNTDLIYTFDNSKVYTVLSDSEILRLYDNVPLKAETLTVMGNRLVYGGYTDGYDLKDSSGFETKLEYNTSLVTQDVASFSVTSNLSNGTYNVGGFSNEVIPQSTVSIDLSNKPLIKGVAISLVMEVSHEHWEGSVTPTDTNTFVSAGFSFVLPKDYTSLAEMVASSEFLEEITTSIPVSNSCLGYSITDLFNCNCLQTLDSGTYTKLESGRDNWGESFSVSATATDELIIQVNAMRYVDNITTVTQQAIEYFRISNAEATYTDVSTLKSLHSDRDYELGIVYMDEYNRSTTALVSNNNTIHVPCNASNKSNIARVEIPSQQVAPSWAARYKFVAKQNEEFYETIYGGISFFDIETGYTYILLDGENSKKVETGDRLKVKVDANGAVSPCTYTTVLEKESKAANFITVPSTQDPTENAYVPAGVYMKVRANNFAVSKDTLTVVTLGSEEVCGASQSRPQINYTTSLQDGNGDWYDYTIPEGSRIELRFNFDREGKGKCNEVNYDLTKTIFASRDYDNIFDWAVGDNLDVIVQTGTSDHSNNIDNVFFTELQNTLWNTEYNPNTGVYWDWYPNDNGQWTNFYGFHRNATNELMLTVLGTHSCDLTGTGNKAKRLCANVSITIYRNNSTLVFETEPSDTNPDIWYEDSVSYSIDSSGNHSGNVQNQDISTFTSAIIDTEFFNCYAFGNGVESFKVRDAIDGRQLRLGNRVTTVSEQDYKQADRFADLTYSGVYNDESNLNRLNVFNMGLLNFKSLEDSFGRIMKIVGRQTDILVLQEDKISYVLAGKNLLSDAAAGGTIASIPEVFGTQLARLEEYGISNHPESFATYGASKFFTDAKRGAVLSLVGGAYSNEVLTVISNEGMDGYFKDMMSDYFNTEKVGGYDMFNDQYILSTNSQEKPVIESCVDCGVYKTFTVTAGTPVNLCVDLGDLVGNARVNWDLISTEGSVTIDTTYNSITTSRTASTPAGRGYTFDKNIVSVSTVDVELTTTTGTAIVGVMIDCPLAEEITVVNVVVSNGNYVGETIHANYRWTDGSFVSPLHSNFVTMASSPTSPVVSFYNSFTGNQGGGYIPADGATVSIIADQQDGDTFTFRHNMHKFRYMRTNTAYGNNDTDITSLLTSSTQASPIENVSGTDRYYADFTMPTTGSHLYFVWDLRESVPNYLCYDSTLPEDACCDCQTISQNLTCESFYFGQVRWEDSDTEEKFITEYVGFKIPIQTGITSDRYYASFDQYLPLSNQDNRDDNIAEGIDLDTFAELYPSTVDLGDGRWTVYGTSPDNLNTQIQSHLVSAYNEVDADVKTRTENERNDLINDYTFIL